MLINCNTAFYFKGIDCLLKISGVMNNKRKDILQHYIKVNFWWDLPVIVFFAFSFFNIPDIKFILLLKTLRV